MVIVLVAVPPPPPVPLPPPDGPVLEPPHAATSTAIAAALNSPQTNFFATLMSCPRLSEKLSRDVESEVPVVGRRAPARDLSHRRSKRIREVELKHMAAGALLDREAALVDARFVSRHPRRELADQIHGRPHVHAGAQADHERVVDID